ncbi:Ger(x)C family spore germination protein [Paenibacillus solisilvae]|uniref:Ger(X)C family spore germination protein n=1 Tax=Paenibacillus solisilvae TaxID=2486751 RepID=A0ABW0VYE5_9BACL
MKQTIKHSIQLLIVVCMAVTLSGCWDNRDINHRSLPVVMGISMHNDLYEVVLQIPEPLQNGINLRIVSESGETINQAVDKISEKMESSVDLLHLKAILIQKEYAKQGLKDSIASFMRARDISPKAIVAICDEDLDPFFANVKRTMAPKGTTLYDSFEKNAGWNPQMALTRIWEVYRSINSYTRDVAIPIYKSGKSGTVNYLGSAIIKNGKMVDQISPEETLLFNAFNGQSTQGKIEVMKSASVLILSNSMSHKSKFINDKPYLKTKITMKVSIVETRGNPTTQIIKKELDELLAKRFKRMFIKTQTREADILGLGQFFRNKIPRKQLQNWRSEYFPNLQLDLRIHTVIQNDGNLKIS